MALWGAHYECIHCPADKRPSDFVCQVFQEKGWCPAVKGYSERLRAMQTERDQRLE
jgi:hypothetical protein